MNKQTDSDAINMNLLSMLNPDGSLSEDMQQNLAKAFQVFSEASEQLSSSYEKLQNTVSRLTEELAIANGELKRQYIEKKNLSEHLETLVRALPGGVLVLDPKRVVETANLAALRLLGSDILSMPWQEIVKRLKPTNAAGEWEIQLGEKTKRLSIASSPFSVQRSATDDSVGNHLIWELREILLIHDMTESHSMRNALASQQKLAAMGEMTASIAHQLRTPLATALIYAGHLMRPDLASEKKQDFAEKLLERLRALEKLMTDMLSYVRGESVFWEEFHSDELLSELINAFEPQMQTANIHFDYEDSLSGVRLLGNKKSLEGALSNLLDNARHACNDAYEDNHAAKHISLKTLLDDNYWVIEVADTGTGIEEKLLENIFDPFYTTRSNGTGLGLPFVQNIAKSHGGSIEVDTEMGKGSTFRLRLPIARRLTSQENS